MIYVEAANMKEPIIKSWQTLKDNGIKRERNNQSKTDECLEIGLCLDIKLEELGIINNKIFDYYAPKCIMFEDIEGLIEYDLEFTEGINDDKFNYTYHKLFAPYLDKCIKELVENPKSRRAVLPIAGEMSYKDEYPPCLQLIMVDISEDMYVNLTVVFRSNDAVKAFPSNLFAIKRLQDHFVGEISERTNDSYWIGHITYIANNFHAYSNDYGMLDGYLNQMKTADDKKLFWTFEEYISAMSEYVSKGVKK